MGGQGKFSAEAQKQAEELTLGTFVKPTVVRGYSIAILDVGCIFHVYSKNTGSNKELTSRIMNALIDIREKGNFDLLIVIFDGFVRFGKKSIDEEDKLVLGTGN